MRRLSITTLLLLLAACGDDRGDSTSATVPDVEVFASTTVPTCDEDFIGCTMTKASPVAGIPLPRDATIIKGDSYRTSVTSIDHLTEWYRRHLVASGWKLDETNSVLDTETARRKNMGEITSALYCKSDPERWVMVILGSARGGESDDVELIIAPFDETDCDST